MAENPIAENKQIKMEIEPEASIPVLDTGPAKAEPEYHIPPPYVDVAMSDRSSSPNLQFETPSLISKSETETGNSDHSSIRPRSPIPLQTCIIPSLVVASSISEFKPPLLKHEDDPHSPKLSPIVNHSQIQTTKIPSQSVSNSNVTIATAARVLPSPVSTSSVNQATLFPVAASVALAMEAKMYGHTDEYSNTTRCICSDNQNQDGFMLQCETCEVWQHGDCVGVNEKAVPEQYFCEICMPNHPIHVLNQLSKQRKSTKSKPTKSKKDSSQAINAITAQPVVARQQIKNTPVISNNTGKVPQQIQNQQITHPQNQTVQSQIDKSYASDQSRIKPKSTNPLSQQFSSAVPRSKKKRDETELSVSDRDRKRNRAEDSVPAVVAGQFTNDPASVEAENVRVASREERKLKQQMALFAKMEDKVKKRERDHQRRGEDDTPNRDERKEYRDDTYNSLPLSNVTTESSTPNAVASAPLSPTIHPSNSSQALASAAATARSQRAKKREEEAAAAIAASVSNGGVANGSIEGKSEAQKASKKFKKIPDSDLDDSIPLSIDQLSRYGDMDYSDFSIRRRIWKLNKILHPSNPFYFGRRGYIMQEYDAEQHRLKTGGWQKDVVSEDIGWNKRLVHNWEKEKLLKQIQKSKPPQSSPINVAVHSNYVTIPFTYSAEKREDEEVAAQSNPDSSSPSSPVPKENTVQSSPPPNSTVTTTSFVASAPVVPSYPMATNRLPVNVRTGQPFSSPIATKQTLQNSVNRSVNV